MFTLELRPANERKSVADVMFGSIQVAELSCNASVGLESFVEAVTNTGNTHLRYDSIGGQFIQNWQTPKLSNKCYQVRMTALDGFTHRCVLQDEVTTRLDFKRRCSEGVQSSGQSVFYSFGKVGSTVFPDTVWRSPILPTLGPRVLSDCQLDLEGSQTPPKSEVQSHYES
jgi:hypothetical protein